MRYYFTSSPSYSVAQRFRQARMHIDEIFICWLASPPYSMVLSTCFWSNQHARDSLGGGREPKRSIDVLPTSKSKRWDEVLFYQLSIIQGGSSDKPGCTLARHLFAGSLLHHTVWFFQRVSGPARMQIEVIFIRWLSTIQYGSSCVFVTQPGCKSQLYCAVDQGLASIAEPCRARRRTNFRVWTGLCCGQCDG